MDLESIWYEMSPYLYSGVGIFSLINGDSGLATASGALLLIATFTIMRMRWVNRHKRAK